MLLKQNILVLLIITAPVLISCNGQNTAKTAERSGQTKTLSATGASDELIASTNFSGKGMRCIFQDKSGNYWLGSYGNGVFLYDNKTISQFTDKNGLCSNFVSDIQQDVNGALWFTTSEGICKFDGKRFVNYTDTIKNTTAKNLKYNKEDLFFFQNGNVYCFNGKIFSRLVIHPSTYQQSPTNLETPYGVYCLLKDKAGNLWLGTDQKGVCRYDGKSFTYFTEKGLDRAAVRAIFQDKHGTIWMGNNGYGLFSYDGNTLTNFTEAKGLGNPDFLNKKNTAGNTETLARVWAINEDKEGNLWIGTIDAGAWKHDGRNLSHYTTSNGLLNNKISTIYKDDKNELWFIAEDEGVSTFDGQRFNEFIR